MNRLFRPTAATVLSLVWILVAGCGKSPPTRFYLLNGLPSPAQEAKTPAGEPCVSIGVGPVSVSDYLDRPQIVSRVTPNELKLAEFDHWAEPLSQMISRVLADHLTSLLCTKTVIVFPWKGSVNVDFQVEVGIIRLDGSLGSNAVLDAQWMVFGLKDAKKMLVSRKMSFTVSTGGADYRTLVSAQSRALSDLSREIAKTLKDQMK
jgi:uncharacterized lipoprotein YmbA